jgi:serine phosphatase RsbU (regulator of sigma subunit)
VDKLKYLVGIKTSGVLIFSKTGKPELFGCSNESLPEFCVNHKDDIDNFAKSEITEISTKELNPDFRESVEKCGFRYLIPVSSKGNVLALLFVGEKLSETEYRKEDLEYLRNIAGQIYIALENAILYEGLARQERIQHELELARNIQLASLPQTRPEVDGLDIAGASVPALEVGGDFYDYLSGESGALTVLVGDVSGKGTSAALYMSKTQGIFRTLFDFSECLSELFIRANAHLYSNFSKSTFVTALAVRIFQSDNKIEVSRSGHLPLYIYRAYSREIEKIRPNGIGLGLTDSQLFGKSLEEIRLDFNSGDALLMVTDGITEARNPDSVEFGEERMLSAFAGLIGESAEAIKSGILNNVNEFTAGEAQYDDQTLIVVKSL